MTAHAGPFHRGWPSGVLGLALLLPAAASAQHHAVTSIHSTDSVTVAAGAHYQAGGFHRWLLGGTYRDLWTRPVRVPVLDLHSFDGGLTVDKPGGGVQTKSLRFVAASGIEYVFRSIDKDSVEMPPDIGDVGFANRAARDMISSSHPAAVLMAVPLLAAAGVLHESPEIVAMPDDPLLGKYRTLFAHRLGVIQIYPSKVSGNVPGFGGALEIIDSDSLLARLNRDPTQHVDARAYLAARLVDMLVNNWDRHPGQWKWARMTAAPDSPWEPIARDYDKAFISVSGFLPGILKMTAPNLVTFDSTYPSMRALTYNSLQLDRRLLSGLSRPVWDSVGRAVSRRITNPVIDAVIQAMPPEYRSTGGPIAAKLRVRRDSIPMIAERFYRYLATVVDVHATDAGDRATIVLSDPQHVEVRLQDANGLPYYERRFNADETRAIRVYLHGGDDRAAVEGDGPSGIPVTVIGGNGTNQLIDSSRAGLHADHVSFVENGTVRGVTYGKDTLFDRRPFVREYGGFDPPERDYGSAATPIAGLSINHDAGVVPRLGMTWYHYGFRDQPYSSMLSVEGRYSFKLIGSQFGITADQRRESSPLHFTEFARMSELELVNWHGLGNSSPQSPGQVINVSAPRTDFYALNQRQYLFQTSIARSLGPTTDLSFGPIVQYFNTDSTPDRFVSQEHPYGFANFGEAGLRLALYRDDRSPPRHAHRGTVLDLSATYYPAVWDVQSAFGVLNAAGAVYFRLPVLPFKAYLGLRGGAKKVFGDFPFEESAFIGGRNDVRTLDLQRYAGDASIYSTAEIRVPVFKFTFILPLNTGLLGTEDIGRVYVNGDSPGGWHNAFGAGFWVAFHELSADIRVMRENEVGRPAVLALRFVVPDGMP